MDDHYWHISDELYPKPWLDEAMGHMIDDLRNGVAPIRRLEYAEMWGPSILFFMGCESSYSIRTLPDLYNVEWLKDDYPF